MKYLFFDIECSNCFQGIGKMCEFGYILTDENFNILKQDDIPMSPGRGRDNRFFLTGRKHEKDLILAYEYDFYLSQPEFPAFYSRIKNLMSDPDTICFAYSMKNDVLHIFNSCKRYHLEQINYHCFDVQLFAHKYLEAKDRVSLKNACNEIVGPHASSTFHEHLSRDDAKIAMKIFEAICELEQISSKDYLEQNSNFGANSNELIDRYFQKKKEKEEKQKEYSLFDSVALTAKQAANEEYVGRRYEISAVLKKSEELLPKIIEYVKEHNGVVINKASLAEYFIVKDEENKQEIMQIMKDYFSGEYILLKDIIPG